MDASNRSQDSLLNSQSRNSNILDSQLIFSKKRELPENYITPCLEIIPKDALVHTISFLSYQNLLTLERTEKKFLDPALTKSFWKNQKITNYLDFNWSMCSKELHQEKCEFRINKAIYLLFSNNEFWNLQDPLKLFSKYSELINRFQFLESIIKTATKKAMMRKNEMLAALGMPKFDLTFFNSETKISNEFVNACNHNQPGESMLHGLMLCSDIDKNKIQIMNCFKKAIETNASCTSLFLCSGPFNNTLPFHDQLNLALQSAKLGDERALWALQNNKEDLKLTENDYIKKTFTFFWLGTRDWNEEAYLHGLKLLKGLKIPIISDSLGAQLLDVAIRYAHDNKNLLLAEGFFDLGIKAYGGKIDTAAFDRAADVKIKLGKLEEAEKIVEGLSNYIFIKIFENHRSSSNNITLINVAHLKFKLGQFEAAYHLFDLALNGSKPSNTLALSKLMSFVVKTKKFETANFFLNPMSDHDKIKFLGSVSKVAFSLLETGQFEMAQRFFNLVITGNEDNSSPHILEIVLNAKKKLGEIKKEIDEMLIVDSFLS